MITNLTGQRLKARHDAIVRTTSNAVYLLSPDLLIETWNPGAARLYGYQPEEIIGHSITELAPPDEIARLDTLDGREGATNAPSAPDVVHRRKDGVLVDVMLNISPMRDRSGVLTGYVVAAHDITERKQAEERLRRSEESHRLFFDNASVGMVSLDLDGRFLRVNPTYCRMTGFTAEELVGRELRTITHPGDFECELETLTRFLEGDIADFVTEKRLIAKDGTPLWVLAQAQMLFDADGKPLQSICVVVDISPMKQAEARLRDSEATFRAMFNVSSVGKVEADPATGRFTRVNAAMCELIGYTEAELLARTFFDITHPDERDQDREKVRQLVAGVASDYDAEKRYMRKDGSSVWVRVTANVVRDKEGLPVRNTAVIQNIDATKRSEIALRESETRYRMAIRAGSLGTWETDLASGQRLWSPEGMALFGLDLAGGVGRIGGGDDDELISRVHPDDRHLHDRYDCDLREAGLITAEYRILLPNGDIRWIAGGGLVLTRDPAGHPVRSVHVAADITERKRAEERQYILMQELAHRGKNLLAVIQSIANRTLTGAKTLSEARTAFGGRLHALAKTYGSLTEEAFEGAPIIDILNGELASFGARASLDGPEIMLTTKVAQTMALVVHELATNAAKYGSLSAPSGKLSVTWSVSDDAERRFLFDWRETGGPPAQEPTRKGFGTTLISTVAAGEFGCTPKLVYAADGFRYRIDATLAVLGKLIDASRARSNVRTETADVRQFMDAGRPPSF